MKQHRWKFTLALLALMFVVGLAIASPAYAQTPTPTPPTDGRLLTDGDLANITKLLTVIAGFITLTVVPAVVLIYNLVKNGQAQSAAGVVIRTEQENRRLVNEGLDPVTMKSPATGTGDGRIDKALATILQQSPASAIAGAVTGTGGSALADSGPGGDTPR